MADIDTGGGNAINAASITERLIEMGVAGVNIEDQVFPKRCGHMEGKQVIPADEMAGKVRAMVDVRARLGDDIVINARTDSYAVHGLHEAIFRANLYLDAGADMVFIDGIRTRADIERAVREIQGLLSVNLMDARDRRQDRAHPHPRAGPHGRGARQHSGGLHHGRAQGPDGFLRRAARFPHRHSGRRDPLGQQLQGVHRFRRPAGVPRAWSTSTCRRQRAAGDGRNRMGMTLAEKILARASGRERVPRTRSWSRAWISP